MLFNNTKQAIIMQWMLKEMGHMQLLMPTQIDNSTENGVITNKIIPKASKIMDMHFHWFWNYKQQKQYQFYWQAGKLDLM